MNGHIDIKFELVMKALLLTALHPLDVDSQVSILVKAGWGNSEISEVTGLAPKAVGMRKLRSKKGNK